MATDKKLVDPITGYIYTGTETGLVEVRDPRSDKQGLFEESGRAVSGELTYANRQLIGWVARAARTAMKTSEEEIRHG